LRIAPQAGTDWAQNTRAIPVLFMVNRPMYAHKNQQLSCFIILGWKQAGFETITQKP
jgi:hypothetical protein